MEPLSEERLKLLLRDTGDLNLAEVVLLLGKEEYPDLDVTAYLHRLDQLAEAVQSRLPPDSTGTEAIIALNEFLFDEEGFSGNTDDFFDPRNSFLNEVLDRKLGIPITLSILYMEVGQRLGLPLTGVSFPGHFLVKYTTEEGEVVLDPFAGGIPVSDDELEERLVQIYGEQAPAALPLPRLLEAAGKKEILVRTLRHLKGVYLQNQQLEKALSAVNRILIVMPEATDEIRDRAQLHDDLECFRAALKDYQYYLELDPSALDSADVRVRIVELMQVISRLN